MHSPAARLELVDPSSLSRTVHDFGSIPFRLLKKQTKKQTMEIQSIAFPIVLRPLLCHL